MFKTRKLILLLIIFFLPLCLRGDLLVASSDAHYSYLNYFNERLPKTFYRHLGKKREDVYKVENNGRMIRDLNMYPDKKFIALTFDDGPSSLTTNDLLDGLMERNARASFFVLGSMAKRHPEIVKRIYDDGHTLASHGYYHRSLLRLNDYELKSDIERANNLLEDLTGVEPKFLRPPYGDHSQRILDKIDMVFILWSVDTLDWKTKSSDSVFHSIVKGGKEGSIVLLHDIYRTSVNGALRAIDELSKDGYLFVSLEELELLSDVSFEKHKIYRTYY